MNAILRVAGVVSGEPRTSAKIARVCEILDCEESQVRKLIDAGDIEAHRIGRRGVRVFLDSVAAYQDRRLREPKGAKKPEGRRVQSKARLAAYNEAVATCRRNGFTIPD